MPAGPLDLKPDKWQRATAIGSLLSVLAVAVGLVVTNNYNRAQHRLAAQGQITDRFTKAVEQLGQSGSEKIDVRLGAIYALQRIMRDSADDQPAVMEILAAFIRVHAPAPKRGTAASPASSRGVVAATPLPVDIQAALTVLIRRNPTHDDERDRLDLTRASLGNADMSGAHLSEADLTGADLTDANLFRAELTGAELTRASLFRADLRDASLNFANLFRANLTNASLTDANLTGASLTLANFTGASLFRANLTNAFLIEANLTNASLSDANLTNANLIGADLRDANLLRANLTDADLRDANLLRANLTDANLTDANLIGANLTDANLTDADLTGTRLNREQLRCSYVNNGTHLPPGVDRPAANAPRTNPQQCKR